MVTVVAVHNLSEPCTDVGNRLVHAAAQFCLNCVQLCHHAFLRRFPSEDERPIAPALPAVMRETQELKPEEIRAILGILAIFAGARTHAKLLIDYSADELLEMEKLASEVAPSSPAEHKASP